LQSDPAALLRLAIGAIVKNEAPYILEWVAYHRVLGFEHFFVADNASDDGTTQLLAALHAIGVVEHFSFPGPPDRPPQLPAYSQIMTRYRASADWIAFIDADEFIYPTEGARSIQPFFSALGPAVGAVVFNWAVFGSSFRHEPSEGLVIERFTRRARTELSANLHYKTAVRSEAYRGVGSNPHFFRLKEGMWTIQADGFEVVDHPEKGPGLSDRLVWTPFRVNHYVVKSRAEFDRKKAPRGRATMSNVFRDDGFFRGHDRNEVVDPMAGWLIEATREGVSALKDRLRSAGVPESIVSLDLSAASLRPLSASPEEG
jgi:glycosyltransferase involved in cell wall biosynthesis